MRKGEFKPCKGRVVGTSVLYWCLDCKRYRYMKGSIEHVFAMEPAAYYGPHGWTCPNRKEKVEEAPK